MASVFTIFGELKAETKGFENSLRRADALLRQTEKSITQTENRAKGLGQTSATTARSFERLREKVGETRTKLEQTATAFQKGDATAKRMQTALAATERSASGLNSKLRDTNARLSDFAAQSGRAASSALALGRGLATGLAIPLTAVGYAAVSSAASLDSLRNRMIAATQSTDAARAKMAELRNVAAETPGMLIKGAVDLYAFFKPLGAGEGTINQLIKAFGRLKMANDEIDLKRMAINLTQLYTQAFERIDLKELVGAFPRAGELLQQAFQLSGSDLDTIGKEMKDKLAKGLSKEDFFAAFADVINKDKGLSLLTDTIGTRFEKLKERVMFALVPLGEVIVGVFERIAPAVVPVIERISAAFNSLPNSIQTVIVAFAGIAAAVGPVAFALSSLGITGAAVVSALKSIGLAVGGLIAVFGPTGVAVAAFAAMWATNFGNIRQVTAQIGETVSATWGTVMQGISQITEEVTEKVAQFWLDNGAEIQKAWENLKQAAQDVSDAIYQLWVQMTKELEVWWQTHGAAVKSIAQDAWDSIRGIIDGALTAILGALKAFAAVLNGDWSRLWQGLGEILAGNAKMIISAVENLASSIVSAFAMIPAQMIAIGRRIGEGLVEGIRSTAPAVVQAGAYIGKLAADATRGAVQVQSPSKVFFGIGEMIGEGLALGIESKTARVRASADGIAKLAAITAMGAITNDSAQSTAVTAGIRGGVSRSGGDTGNRGAGGENGSIFGMLLDPSSPAAVTSKWTSTIEGIGDVFANAVAYWDGTAKGFFKSIASGFKQMAQQIIAELLRIAVMQAVLKLVGAFAGGASAGGANAGLMGGLKGAAGFAAGGFTGHGNRNSPAGIVHRGEFVMPMEAVKKFGLGFMESIRSLQMPMGMMPAMAGGASNTYNNSRTNNFNINVAGGGGSRADSQRTAYQVRAEIMKALMHDQERNK